MACWFFDWYLLMLSLSAHSFLPFTIWRSFFPFPKTLTIFSAFYQLVIQPVLRLKESHLPFNPDVAYYLQHCFSDYKSSWAAASDSAVLFAACSLSCISVVYMYIRYEIHLTAKCVHHRGNSGSLCKGPVTLK